MLLLLLPVLFTSSSESRYQESNQKYKEKYLNHFIKYQLIFAGYTFVVFVFFVFSSLSLDILVGCGVDFGICYFHIGCTFYGRQYHFTLIPFGSQKFREIHLHWFYWLRDVVHHHSIHTLPSTVIANVLLLLHEHFFFSIHIDILRYNFM